MCGICGIMDLTRHGRVAQEAVWHMTQRIVHRGPDGDGFYTTPNIGLGMRRLSIIDVTGSDQPLFNEDRSIALVFNGEIYNYRELRQDLLARGHRFHTDGDGETLIHLYEEHGLDCFRYLRGMYGFALWDSRAERLVLAVDHIGMKPLYLYEHDGMLLFASEVKALLADPGVPRQLNLEVLDTYLSFGYMIGAETLFADIRRLPSGHAYVIEKDGQPRLHTHWDFGRTRPAAHWDVDGVDLNDADSVVQLARKLIADSVHIHLRSDVPLGLFLSGGVDSAAVLALMAQEAEGRIKTYTIGYDMDVPDNELAQAKRIAAHFQTEHHERIISASDWWQGFEQYVYAHDEPNANPSAVSLLLLSEMTAQHVKVVLTGLGGDELFGGYPFHRMIPQLLARQSAWGWLGSRREGGSPLQRLLELPEPFYPAMKRYRYIGALPTYLPRVRHALLPRNEALLRMQSFDGMVFSDSLRRRLYGPDLRATWQQARHREHTYARIVEKSWRDDPYNTAQALVVNTWLTGNALLSQDKTAMAHALEARVPFFDPVLLDFAAHVPPSIRMHSNKYVLREAIRPYAPSFAVEQPKQPFSTPILNWFAGDLAGRIQEILRDPGAGIRTLFDAQALDRLLDAHFRGQVSHTEVIFRLLTLEMWQQRFLESANAIP